MFPLAQTPNSVQLRACRDVGIDHQKMELFLLPFLVDGAEEHTAGFDAHHGPGRQVRDGDAGLADELFRFVVFMDTGQDGPRRIRSVVQSELQELL